MARLIYEVEGFIRLISKHLFQDHEKHLLCSLLILNLFFFKLVRRMKWFLLILTSLIFCHLTFLSMKKKRTRKGFGI